MAGLLGGKKSNAQTPTVYTQLQLQTSAQGVCIPLVWGRTRIGTNVFWYNNFQQHKVKSGKGGSSKGGGNYTYTAAVMLGLCEGEVPRIGAVWAGDGLSNLGDLGLGLFGGTPGQAPWSYLESAYPDQALSYSNTAYVASPTYQLGSSASLPAVNFEVYGNLLNTGGIGGDEGDADPSQVLYDLFTNTTYGFSLDPTTYLGDMSLLHNYCGGMAIAWSPALTSQEQGTTVIDRWATLCNSWIFWDGSMFQFLPLSGQGFSEGGYLYSPVTTAAYDLGPDDFVVTKPGTPPVDVDRIDPLDGYNQVQIDIKDRGNNYNSTPITWQDQASVDEYGILPASIVQADEINIPSIGYTLAALLGQRLVYIRNTYKFKLGPGFILLMVGDLVTLSVPNMALRGVFARVRTLEEDDQGIISVEAEEFPFGTGNAPAMPAESHTSTNAVPNVYSTPPDVNVPAFFEPSPDLTGGVPQVWVAVSGGANWGGCAAYISFDGSSFVEIGEISQSALQGTTRALLPATADPDTIDTLSIDLTESLGIIPTVATHDDADAGRTLALVGSEVVTYGTVAPTGSYTAALTYLRRGQYGTAVAAHASGTQFSRMDPSTILTYDLPQQYVGVPLYFKFCSVNILGGAAQDISTVTEYTYTPIGVGYDIAAPTSPVLAVSTPAGAASTSMTLSWTASAGPSVGSYEAQFSSDSGTTWAAGDTTVGSTALSATLSTVTASANYVGRVRAISANGLAVSSWSQSSVVNSGPAPSTGGGSTLLPLVNGDNPVGLIADSSGVPIQVKQ